MCSLPFHIRIQEPYSDGLGIVLHPSDVGPCPIKTHVYCFLQERKVPLGIEMTYLQERGRRKSLWSVKNKL